MAPQSRANYLDTELSLSSLLNGAHLGDLGMDMDEPPNDAFLYGAVSNNQTMAFLRGIGYEIVGIGWATTTWANDRSTGISTAARSAISRFGCWSHR